MSDTPKLKNLLKKTEEKQATHEDYIDEKLEPTLDVSAYSDLTEQEKADIEAEVRAQVAEELRAQRKRQFKKEILSKYRNLSKPGEQIVPICLDLPGHANDVRLDGRVFFHGVTYRVNTNVYKTLIDIQARAWEHENEIGGANRDLYRGRKPVERVITPTSVQNNNRLAPMVKF